MAELDTAADQPQETTEVAGSGLSDLLDEQEDGAEESAEASSEPSAEEAEPEPSGETEAEGEQSEEAGQEQGEQTSSMDEYLASLSPEERSYYAKRYPTMWKLANDPDQPEDVRQILRDKINTDFEYRALREQGEAEGEEPEAEPAPAASSASQPANPQEAYQKFIADTVQNFVDPKEAEKLGKTVLGMVGWNLDLLNDPKAQLTPEMREELRNVAAKAAPLGQALATGAVDLAVSTAPAWLPGMVNQLFPGFGEMYERSMYALQWDKVRESSVAGPDGKAQKPYASLPAYGTPQFQQVLRKAAEQIPGFDEMVFRGKDGRILPPHEQANRKYSMLAKIARGQSPNPAVVREAVETGKRLKAAADQKKAAGRALGSGQSRGQLSAPRSGNDDLFGAPGELDSPRIG